MFIALSLLPLASGLAPARFTQRLPTGLAASPATGSGPGLDYNPEKYAKGSENFGRLSDKLNEADVERRKEEDAALAREQAAERAREERLAKVKFMNDMDDNTEAGTIDEYMFKEGVKDVLDKLDNDLVGLVPVKTRVRQIAALLVMDKMRRKLGFETSVPSLHMCFTGAPGTGKTTVAVRMGQILARMGYCRSGHVVVATRDDLVGQYVGHTAPKTKEVIKKAMGGVLLIDEAYYLYNAANDRDYGQESIEILLNVMESQRDALIVVLAGYKDRMDKFFSYIPGMNSRVGNHIEFPNYEKEELVSIAKVMARDLEYEMSDEASGVFEAYMERRMTMPYFSNARTVRNAMDRARMNSAIRTFKEATGEGGDGMVSVKQLKTIEGPDVDIMLEEILNADDDAIFA
jgi:probable Rubsico expression protein CbbX